MKISDPIGKVYQHSMFKKKTYNIPKGGDTGDMLDRARSHSEDEDEDGSEISDQSDDSLSTKSSRIVASSRRARTRSTSRHTRRGTEEERDREDAISYASRHERGRRHRSSSKRPAAKKYGLESLGAPAAGSYSLWTAQKSVARDHKRKFNRSMCGVLLGVSIVLVVLGILGIIGIAVYLGVVQKIESPERDLISIDGAFRVVSEDFSLTLLNPASPAYKRQEEKFTGIIEKTFRKSYLKDAFVKTVIDGFSSGSIKVFFKVILDGSKLSEQQLEDPVMASKDVLVQEVMSLDRSEFQDTIIDIDSIDFSLSAVQDVAEKYLEPEPFQGEQQQTTGGSVGAVAAGGSLWQNLAQSTARSVPRPTTEDPWSQPPVSAATERSDGLQSGFYGETPLNANGWSLPRHPVNLGYDRGVAASLGRPSVASVVTPHAPLIISPHSGRAKLSSYLPAQLAPVSPSYPPALPATRTRRPFAGDTEISSRRGPAADLMSEYMEPPPPPAASSRLGSLNSLESLFPPPGPTQSVQSAAPSEVNFKLTPKPQPQTQNRRLDPGEAGDYSERFNGFWNMLHKPEAGQQQQARPGQPRPGVSSKEERIQSMQEELEQLLRLESEESSSAQQLQLYDQIQRMDDAEIQLLADNLAPLLEPRPGSPPQPGNPWRAKPSSAQQQQDPVSINNFGSSGLKTVNTDTGGGVRGSTTTARPSTVMDIHVPQGQDTGFFGVGSSLSFAGGEAQEPGRVGAVLNSVGSLHSDQVVQQRGVLGRDPNIVYPHQIRGGQQLRQGPQGPIVSSPRPRPSLAVPQTPLAPQLPHPELGSRQGSAATRRPGLVAAHRADTRQQQQQQQQASRRAGQVPGDTDIIGNILPAAIGLSGSAGISPIGIFSNLLNAYATIDSKHDLTGKLINSAASWLQPAAEVRTTGAGEVTPGPASSTAQPTPAPASAASLAGKGTEDREQETSTEKPVTNISVRVREEGGNNNQYQSIFDKIRAAAQSKDSEYDIVTSHDLPPMKSNIFSEGPLRPKPPSEDIIQVSPAPQEEYSAEESQLQFGVNNPHWYSNEIQASTAGYGPDDFIVETVNLDKNFFYQFFTSKPMIIDTDVVTSTSVQVKYDKKPKKGREANSGLFKRSRETLMNLPEHLIGKEILPNHILKKTGEAFDDELFDASGGGAEGDLVHSSEFKRYNLPPEIQITSGGRGGKEMAPPSASSESGDQQMAPQLAQ